METGLVHEDGPLRGRTSGRTASLTPAVHVPYCSPMLALLPLLFLGAAVAWALPRCADLRQALLRAATLTAVVAVALVELTSLAHGLTRPVIATAWALALAVVLVGVWRRRPGPVDLPRVGLWDAVLLLAPVAIAVATLLSGALSAPNNWDSMTYHLARVAQWLRAGSVEFYPTTILRQLYQAPGAEFLLAHFQLLAGGDRLAFLVQWLALLGSLVGASSIARQLGAGRTGQLLSAAVVATLPTVILQASSTQNDLVTAFWLVVFTDSALRVRRGDGSVDNWLTLGASLGLALLTKGTAYVYCAPFALWLAASLLRQRAWRHLAPLALAVVVACTLNAGYWVRNAQVYGSPLGPGREGNAYFLNRELTAKNALSGIVRNGVLHLASRNGAANVAKAEWVTRSLRALGIDSNDRRTTYEGVDFRMIDESTHEDWAVNRAHFLLFGFGLLVSLGLAVGRRRVADLDTLWWALCAVGGFVLFASTLQWQLWHGRLHVPAFVLFSPAVAVVAESVRRRFAHAALALTLLGLAVPWALSNTSRPLWPMGAYTHNPPVFSAARDDQYFINRTDIREPYQRAARCLTQSRCETVGLLAGEDSWEYPLWVYVSRSVPAVRFVHLELPADNPSATASGEQPPEPCAVLGFGRSPQAAKGLTRSDGCSSGQFQVFLR